MQLSSDVFPAPLGPMRPRMVDESTSKLRSSRTVMPPNRKVTLEIERATVIRPAPVSGNRTFVPRPHSSLSMGDSGIARREPPPGEALALTSYLGGYKALDNARARF